ncbi:hypothetical protein [Kribbella catacumbae]|uniref:hypothetical protein n=1 Tax=Kribbella catacumbae TaxID=460086 RepID=UPI00037C2B0F|nr:hypothetical protein [Kribbella catacumbae]
MTETDYKFDLPPQGYVPADSGLPAQAAAEVQPVEPMSDLDLLKADLPDVQVEDVKLPVPGRDLYAVTFSTDISEPELEKWRKLSKNKKHEGGVDGIRLGCLVLANKCVGIYRDGRLLQDSDGDPLRFAHQEFLELVGTPSAAEAVKTFYKLDASITSTGDAVLRAAGWGDQLDPLDL